MRHFVPSLRPRHTHNLRASTLRHRNLSSSPSIPPTQTSRSQKREIHTPIIPRQPAKMAANLPAHSAATQTLQNYTFPRQGLSLMQRDPSKTPLVLVACGSVRVVLPLRVAFLHRSCFRSSGECRPAPGNFYPNSLQK